MRRLAIGIAVVAALVVLWLLLPIREWVIAFVEWIRDRGPWAAAIFGITYVVGAVLLVPGSALTIGAGFIYGVVGGSIVVVLASNASALISFLVARRFGRHWVAKRVEGNKKFEALDRAISRAGFKITLLVRLSPIFPYSLLNYALGLTDVRLRQYVAGTALGMLPGTFVAVYAGSLLTSAADIGKLPSGAWSRVFYFGGFAVAVAALVATTLVARNALRRELQKARA
ncbi:MAG: TVP38/TMEM64 family protein [Myxococcota bacterium]|nr:TVP38/TMEM64 family protein [Myxococcota bacterium]